MSSLITSPGFRRLFNLTSLIPRLLEGQTVSCETIERELFLVERAMNVRFPDHVYKQSIVKQRNLLGTNSLRGLVMGVLRSMAEELLEFRGRHIYVRRESLQDWVDTTTWVSPLLLRMVALRMRKGPIPGDDAEAADFVRNSILPAVEHSLVTVPFAPAMQRLVESKGLVESHMHFNGTTEADLVWLYVLDRRREVVKELDQAETRSPGSVAELLALVERGLSIKEFGTRLRLSRRLRWMMLELATGGKRRTSLVSATKDLHVSLSTPTLRLGGNSNQGGISGGGVKFGSRQHLMSLLRVGSIEGDDYDKERLLTDSPTCQVGLVVPKVWSRLRKEAILLYQILDFLWDDLESERDEAYFLADGVTFDENLDPVSHLFYLYCLLWMGNGQALLVQRPEQTGFDQFQNLTLDGLREASERDFAHRFRQLSRYTPLPDLTILEGRFAPKSDAKKMRQLLSLIFRGYDTFLKTETSSIDNEELPPLVDQIRSRKVGPSSMDIRLVSHFIKERDFARDEYLRRDGSADGVAANFFLTPPCRWSKLRTKHKRQLSHLLNLRRVWSRFHEHWVGIDAASNELHTPPEVFAPLYRSARNAGIKGFTYHVGEEFHHLVSGLRAIEEAITFLGLGNGDRLGHATAAGINPGLWRDRMPKRVVMTQGEWLDNLVFAYHCFTSATGFDYAALRCSSEIARLSPLLFENCTSPPSPELLRESWEMRSLDALVFADLAPYSRRDFNQLEEKLQIRSSSTNIDERLEATRFLDCAKRHPSAFELYAYYHRASSWIAWEKACEVSIDFFSVEELAAMQRHVLCCIRRHGIVVETLPTSNLRISFYQSMAEHHVFRWLGYDDPAERIPVIVGSDDPGIFNTCLRLEYELLRDAARTA